MVGSNHLNPACETIEVESGRLDEVRVDRHAHLKCQTEKREMRVVGGSHDGMIGVRDTSANSYTARLVFREYMLGRGHTEYKGRIVVCLLCADTVR